MKLSTYQQTILEWTRNSSGSAAIDAKAGSGKTSTLVKVVAPEIRGCANFVAFNKHIADELSARLPRNVGASTIHSSGFRAIRKRHPRTKVDAENPEQIRR